MPKKLIQRYLPDPEVIKGNRYLRFLGSRILDANLWHLNRRSAALAFFVGIFVAFIPMPMQMVLSAALALLVRCNLPLSVALVWITNPVTMPIMFYATYKLGCFILQTPASHGFEMTLQWFTDEFSRIWMPLYLGSVVSGLFFGALSYFGIRLLWRWHIVRSWRQRKNRHSAAGK